MVMRKLPEIKHYNECRRAYAHNGARGCTSDQMYMDAVHANRIVEKYHTDTFDFDRVTTKGIIYWSKITPPRVREKVFDMIRIAIATEMIQFPLSRVPLSALGITDPTIKKFHAIAENRPIEKPERVAPELVSAGMLVMDIMDRAGVTVDERKSVYNLITHIGKKTGHEIIHSHIGIAPRRVEDVVASLVRDR